MFTDLNEIKKPNEIKTFSYVDVKAVLAAIDEVSLSKLELIDATEILDHYIEILRMIDTCVYEDRFPECKTKTSKATIYQNTARLREKLGNYIDLSNFMRTNQAMFQVTVDNAQKKTTKIVENLKLDINNLERSINEATVSLDNSEHNILTHVLTLLGVFSAIIITIMSVVITASSWLNSGNSNDAIAAFVIPVVVTIIAVITLMMLVYCLYIKVDKKHIAFVLYTVFIVAILVGMICYCYKQNVTYEPLHVRYIIDETEYTIIKKDDSQYYEFTIDEKTYTYSCDDMFLHNNEIHFCTLHNTIE